MALAACGATAPRGTRLPSARTGSPPFASRGPSSSTSAATGSGAAGTSTSEGHLVARCRAAGLRTVFKSSTGVGGTGFGFFTITNDGTSDCSLGGYPGLQLLSAVGAALPTTVIRDASIAADQLSNGRYPERTYVIRPGGFVQFEIRWLPCVGQSCAVHWPTAYELRITPPNDHIAQVISATPTSVGGSGHGIVVVKGQLQVSYLYP